METERNINNDRDTNIVMDMDPKKFMPMGLIPHCSEEYNTSQKFVLRGTIPRKNLFREVTRRNLF
jgi:hypothetical protein